MRSGRSRARSARSWRRSIVSAARDTPAPCEVRAAARAVQEDEEMSFRRCCTALAFLFSLAIAGAADAARSTPRVSGPRAERFEGIYEQDVAFALDELEKRCGAL